MHSDRQPPHLSQWQIETPWLYSSLDEFQFANKRLLQYWLEKASRSMFVRVGVDAYNQDLSIEDFRVYAFVKRMRFYRARQGNFSWSKMKVYAASHALV